jgi:hypothetical protein
MKYSLNNFLFVGLLTYLAITHATSIIIPRSQSVNAARELVGWQKFINRASDEDCNGYGSFSFTAEYEQSFRSKRLLQCLFDGDIITTSTVTGLSCNNNNKCANSALKIQGRCVANRNPNAWLADYFGLDPSFDSVVYFNPKVQNAIFDFNLYVGLDEWTPGAYFRIHAPLVWTKWRLNATETVNVAAASVNPGYQPGYMSGLTTQLTNLRTSFLSATDGTYTFGDMQTPLAFGRFCNNNCSSLVKLSDIEMALGYNFLLCEDQHVGLNIRGSAPTGNKPTGRCVFEPIVGNGKFWTLGAGLSAHTVLWRDCDSPDKTFNFYIDANITHLFNSCQRRSFDLVGKPNSRYMLIEQFAAPKATTVVGTNFPAGAPALLFSNPTAAAAAGSTALTSQYASNLFNLIDKSTFDTKISYAGQADIAIKFSFMSCNWDIDLGYEFWGRSREKICFCTANFPAATYALKGDVFLYGFTPIDSATLGINSGNAIALSATQSHATIHDGGNVPITGGPCQFSEFLNPSIDFPRFAMFGLNGNPPAATTDQLIQEPDGFSGATVQQRTSNQPVFLRASDLNVEGSNSVITNKIFGNISYAWESACWSPFIGIGAEVEFATGNNPGSCATNSASSSCCPTFSPCTNSCVISQWGIWIKGGLAFN